MSTKPKFQPMTIEDLYNLMFGDESKVREIITNVVNGQASDEVIEDAVNRIVRKKVAK